MLMLSETQEFVDALADMMYGADLPFFTNVTTRSLTLTVPLKKSGGEAEIRSGLSSSGRFLGKGLDPAHRVHSTPRHSAF